MRMWKRQAVEKKRGGKTEVSLTLILSQLFLPYQACPDMGGQHVPTMHCGFCPSAWNEPLTLSYQLRGRLPVPMALHLWIQGKICMQSSLSQTHTRTQTNSVHNDMCKPQTPPWAIKSCVLVTSLSTLLSKLAVQTKRGTQRITKVKVWIMSRLWVTEQSIVQISIKDKWVKVKLIQKCAALVAV